jgi:hypothetical protein
MARNPDPKCVRVSISPDGLMHRLTARTRPATRATPSPSRASRTRDSRAKNPRRRRLGVRSASASSRSLAFGGHGGQRTRYRTRLSDAGLDGRDARHRLRSGSSVNGGSADRQRDVRPEETMSRTIIVLILGLTLSACQGQRFNSSSVGGEITHQPVVVSRG